MRRILGIDPALARTGWGIIDVKSQNEVFFVAAGVVETTSDQPMNLRLRFLANDLLRVVNEYKPSEVAIEETFVNKNPLSSLKLGQARGAIIITIANVGLEISEYAATAIKKNITGMGRADKEQVQRMVKLLLPKSEVKYNDEADALAVALCHMQHSQFKSLLS